MENNLASDLEKSCISEKICEINFKKMNALAQAATQLRYLTGNVGQPIYGHTFSHALHNLHKALESEDSPSKSLDQQYLQKAIDLVRSISHVKNNLIPTSCALTIFDCLEHFGVLPPPAECMQLLADDSDITPVMPIEVLKQGNRTVSARRVATHPKTNDEGFLLILSKQKSPTGSEYNGVGVSRFVLCDWSPEYKRHMPIGSGGHSDVYKAQEDDSPVPVAIKIAAIRDPSDRDPILNRFANGKYFQRLLGRDHFVDYIEAGRLSDGTPFIVMELMRESLAKFVEQEPLSADDAFSLGLKSIIPVAIMHTKVVNTSHGRIVGIVHGDIKPENLLFSLEGRLKLSDFDLTQYVKDIGHSPDQEGLGTPGFMVINEKKGTWSDVFALGATLFYIHTGERAFSGKRVKDILFDAVNKDRRILREKLLERGTNEALAQIILKALSPIREERYKDALELYYYYSTFKARTLEGEADRLFEQASDLREGKEPWKIKVEEALREYDVAYQEYPHPEILQRMLTLHFQLSGYAREVGDKDAMRYAEKRLARLTPQNLRRIPIYKRS